MQHVQRVWPSCCDVLRCVATCWVLLAQIWKWSNFSCKICGCCMMLQSFGQFHATMLRLGMRTSLIFNSQHEATLRNRVAKRAQHVAPNNVAICCVKMLRSFGRSLQKLGQQCWDMLRWDVAIVWPGLTASNFVQSYYPFSCLPLIVGKPQFLMGFCYY